LFYANDDGVLAFLESPDEKGAGEFVRKNIKLPDEDGQLENVKVSPTNRQVAAITWNTRASNTKEV